VTFPRKRTAPVLQGRIDGAHVVVWCEHCNREHSHGRHDPNSGCKHLMSKDDVPCTCPVGSGDGHRVAHCHDPNSPYHDGGYTIEELAKPKTTRSQQHQQGSHVLYRFFDAGEQLLYIGITANPPQRFKAHQTEKGWWDAVSGIRIETFESRAQLVEAERVAIQAERPLYNIVHNSKKASKSGPPRSEDWADDNPTKCPGCGAGEREWERQPSISLVGKWFHTTETCGCGRRECRGRWSDCDRRCRDGCATR
jgi:predicted GIY-YIG superfamily endonuclease